MVTDNMNHIYVSIHAGGPELTETSQLSWRILVQSQRASSLFHHPRKPEFTVYQQRGDSIEGRRYTKDDSASQVLRVLIGENAARDLFSQVQTAFNQLRGDASCQHMIQRLQHVGVVKRFDLRMFTTIVEDRLRLIEKGPRRDLSSEEMNYLSYCSTPASAKSAAGSSVAGSDYFLSAYEAPVKKSKRGFWLSYPQAAYRSAEMRDPYGGLM